MAEMSSLDMHGPHPLDAGSIDGVVDVDRIGNYALSESRDGTFYVHYVGRSDNDVRRRLHDHCDGPNSRFKYSYADSAKAAFDKECKNYHDFEPSQNKVHPARPDDANWKCPVCGHSG